MTRNPPLTIAGETITGVEAGLREWIDLKVPGIVWIRYVSDRSRDLVLEQLLSASPITRIEFNPPDPTQSADWLEDQLTRIAAQDSLPVVAVIFAPLLELGDAGLAAAFRSLNLRREAVARSRMIQLWWAPASLAPKAEAEALDLASWFQIKLNLSEIAAAAQPRIPLETHEPWRLYLSPEALKRAEDAVSRQRKLAELDPQSYSPQLAAALNNLGVIYASTQRTKEAEAAYKESLLIRRRLAEITPDAYLPDLATTLNNVGNLYRDTQRMKESETAFAEALSIGRRLAEMNPQAQLPGLARTLNNLGVLYTDTQRMKRAETAFAEALSIRRLAEMNLGSYLPAVATTLNNLGNLYTDTQRMKEAESAYSESLSIRRRLAETNPDAYLPDVASTLNNLAVLYSDTQRMIEADQACEEAQRILEPLWQRNPEVHGDRMAQIFLVRADLCGPTRNDVACEYARRALGAAYAADLKKDAQELMDRFCG